MPRSSPPREGPYVFADTGGLIREPPTTPASWTTSHSLPFSTATGGTQRYRSLDPRYHLSFAPSAAVPSARGERLEGRGVSRPPSFSPSRRHARPAESVTSAFDVASGGRSFPSSTYVDADQLPQPRPTYLRRHRGDEVVVPSPPRSTAEWPLHLLRSTTTAAFSSSASILHTRPGEQTSGMPSRESLMYSGRVTATPITTGGRSPAAGWSDVSVERRRHLETRVDDSDVSNDRRHDEDEDHRHRLALQHIVKQAILARIGNHDDFRRPRDNRERSRSQQPGHSRQRGNSSSYSHGPSTNVDDDGAPGSGGAEGADAPECDDWDRSAPEYVAAQVEDEEDAVPQSRNPLPREARHDGRKTDAYVPRPTHGRRVYRDWEDVASNSDWDDDDDPYAVGTQGWTTSSPYRVRQPRAPRNSTLLSPSMNSPPRRHGAPLEASPRRFQRSDYFHSDHHRDRGGRYEGEAAASATRPSDLRGTVDRSERDHSVVVHSFDADDEYSVVVVKAPAGRSRRRQSIGNGASAIVAEEALHVHRRQDAHHHHRSIAAPDSSPPSRRSAGRAAPDAQRCEREPNGEVTDAAAPNANAATVTAAPHGVEQENDTAGPGRPAMVSDPASTPRLSATSSTSIPPRQPLYLALNNDLDVVAPGLAAAQRDFVFAASNVRERLTDTRWALAHRTVCSGESIQRAAIAAAEVIDYDLTSACHDEMVLREITSRSFDRERYAMSQQERESAGLVAHRIWQRQTLEEAEAYARGVDLDDAFDESFAAFEFATNVTAGRRLFIGISKLTSMEQRTRHDAARLHFAALCRHHLVCVQRLESLQRWDLFIGPSPPPAMAIEDAAFNEVDRAMRHFARGGELPVMEDVRDRRASTEAASQRVSAALAMPLPVLCREARNGRILSSSGQDPRGDISHDETSRKDTAAEARLARCVDAVTGRPVTLLGAFSAAFDALLSATTPAATSGPLAGRRSPPVGGGVTTSSSRQAQALRRLERGGAEALDIDEDDGEGGGVSSSPADDSASWITTMLPPSLVRGAVAPSMPDVIVSDAMALVVDAMAWRVAYEGCFVAVVVPLWCLLRDQSVYRRAMCLGEAALRRQHMAHCKAYRPYPVMAPLMVGSTSTGGAAANQTSGRSESAESYVFDRYRTALTRPPDDDSYGDGVPDWMKTSSTSSVGPHRRWHSGGTPASSPSRRRDVVTYSGVPDAANSTWINDRSHPYNRCAVAAPPPRGHSLSPMSPETPAPAPPPAAFHPYGSPQSYLEPRLEAAFASGASVSPTRPRSYTPTATMETSPARQDQLAALMQRTSLWQRPAPPSGDVVSTAISPRRIDSARTEEDRSRGVTRHVTASKASAPPEARETSFADVTVVSTTESNPTAVAGGQGPFGSPTTSPTMTTTRPPHWLQGLNFDELFANADVHRKGTVNLSGVVAVVRLNKLPVDIRCIARCFSEAAEAQRITMTGSPRLARNGGSAGRDGNGGGSITADHKLLLHATLDRRGFQDVMRRLIASQRNTSTSSAPSTATGNCTVAVPSGGPVGHTEAKRAEASAPSTQSILRPSVTAASTIGGTEVAPSDESLLSKMSSSQPHGAPTAAQYTQPGYYSRGGTPVSTSAPPK